MGHGRWMRDQAFDATQGFGKREVLQVTNKLSDGIVPSFELQADNGAKALLLAPGHVMTGMAGQTRVIHLATVGLLLEPLSQCRRVSTMMVQSRMQGSQAAQRH